MFSQTICIVPASNFVLTPFTLINTYLNIPDCKGKESLFEAEMNRVFRHLNQVRGLRGSEYAFGVMDEIFNSTNPEEGVSGAYVIGKKLAKYKNSICLITTHFNYITKLEKETGAYRNFHFPINRNESNDILYNYQLKSGISQQYIALELLKQRGFDNELIEEASKICKFLVKNNNKLSSNTSSNKKIKNIKNKKNIENKVKTEAKNKVKTEVRDKVKTEPENKVKTDAKVKTEVKKEELEELDERSNHQNNLEELKSNQDGIDNGLNELENGIERISNKVKSLTNHPLE